MTDVPDEHLESDGATGPAGAPDQAAAPPAAPKPDEPLEPDEPDESHEAEWRLVRREVSVLTLVGIVLCLVAGGYLWVNRWSEVAIGSAEVGVDDRTVGVWAVRCGGESRLHVDVHDDRIVLALDQRDGDRSCATCHLVDLPEPIGGRPLVDERSGFDVPTFDVPGLPECPDA